MTDNTQSEAMRLAEWLFAAVQIYPQRSEDDPGGYASEVDQVMAEAADEFLSDDATTWAIDPNGIFVGNIYGGHVLRPARRRIKGG